MTIQEGINQAEQAYQKINDATHLINSAIMNAFLFRWQWWLGIALFIIPWIVWFRFRKKESTDRLLYAGLSSILIGLIIDMFATSTGKWSYPILLIPNSGLLLLPYHFSLLPVGVMSALQWKPNVNPLIKGIVFGAFCAYLIEPFFVMTGFYNPRGWPFTYDVFIYVSIYLVAHWLSAFNNFDPFRSKDKVDHEFTLNFPRKKQKAK